MAIRQWNNHRGSLLDTVEHFDVIDCTTCGFKHIVPIPTDDELHRIYKHEYYTKEKPLYLKRYREDLDWWELVFNERYETLEQLLSSGGARILDIGSGPGYFLLQGKRRGWDVVGIEPSPEAAEHARHLGIKVINDFFNETTAPKLGLFDVVHMSEVLEHVPDPLKLLELARGLLKSGGLICIIVPNDYNPFQIAIRQACGHDPWWLAPPHHINYFDPNSLKDLLRKCNFQIVSTQVTFPIDLFLLMGKNYIGNDELGRECHSMRKSFELNMAKANMNQLRHKLYEAFASLGIGREIQIIGNLE